MLLGGNNGLYGYSLRFQRGAGQADRLRLQTQRILPVMGRVPDVACRSEACRLTGMPWRVHARGCGTVLSG